MNVSGPQSPDPLPTKAEVRAAVRAHLANLTSPQRQEAAATLAAKLARLLNDLNVRSVLVYAPFADELPLLPHFLALPVHTRVTNLCFPRCDWQSHTLVPVPVRAESDLRPTSNLRLPPEPRGNLAPLPAHELQAIVTPGLAFDPHCNRLGRGGGFYDRLLATRFVAEKTLKATTIALAADVQVVDRVPTDAWDQPLDQILTPTTAYKRPSFGA
jgi:5-formyltetrahydrofolate cyclo-ligase